MSSAIVTVASRDDFFSCFDRHHQQIEKQFYDWLNFYYGKQYIQNSLGPMYGYSGCRTSVRLIGPTAVCVCV